MRKERGKRSWGESVILVCPSQALASMMNRISCHLHCSIEEVGRGGESNHFPGGWRFKRK